MEFKLIDHDSKYRPRKYVNSETARSQRIKNKLQHFLQLQVLSQSIELFIFIRFLS